MSDVQYMPMTANEALKEVREQFPEYSNFPVRSIARLKPEGWEIDVYDALEDQVYIFEVWSSDQVIPGNFDVHCRLT